MESPNIAWFPWTPKSEGIPYESTTEGVGPGEYKVAAELGTSVLGQNSNHDMEPIINGSKSDCDVKQLDEDKSFNTGVKGRNALRPIKNEVSNLLNAQRNIVDSSFLSEEERAKILHFQDVSPDELGQQNIQKLINNCSILHKKEKELRETLPKVDSTFRGVSYRVPLDEYETVCKIHSVSLPSEYESYKPTLDILQNLSHPYIKNPNLLGESLNNLVNIFNGLTLIFVDKNKGYCFWNDIVKIKFLRITRGHPRFRLYP